MNEEYDMIRDGEKRLSGTEWPETRLGYAAVVQAASEMLIQRLVSRAADTRVAAAGLAAVCVCLMKNLEDLK